LQIYNLLLKESLSADEISSKIDKNLEEVLVSLTKLEIFGLVTFRGGSKYSLQKLGRF
jgi:predicted transcriptional regulator